MNSLRRFAAFLAADPDRIVFAGLIIIVVSLWGSAA